MVSCRINAALRQTLVSALAIQLVFGQGDFCTPENLNRFSGGTWPEELDASLYWFGHDDEAEKATGGASKFYDPTKPTMLYFHGWTGAGGGWTKLCKRLTTRCHADICPNGGGQLLVNDWLKAGWNVGFFYWDQFADEACVRTAEQKLWFDRKGDGFTWKSYNVGTGQVAVLNYEAAASQPSVSDMCADEVRRAMGSFSGPEVRFVGHSLGAQLATRCAALLHVENHRASPQRLALLEPYFSKHSNMMFFGCNGAKITTSDGLDDFAAQSTVEFVKNLWESKNVVTEVYKSSILTEGGSGESNSAVSQLKKLVQNGAAASAEDALVGNLASGSQNGDLERAATVVKYEPDWCSGVVGGSMVSSSGDVKHIGCRHCAVMPLYLLGFGRVAPDLQPAPSLGIAEPGSAIRSCETPAASCTNGQVREWIQRQLVLQRDQSWNQVGGQNTFDGIDDTFTVTPTLEETAQLGLTTANSIVLSTALELPPANQVPLWLQILTSPLFLIPAVAVCIGSIVGTVICVLRSDGSEDSEEEQELTGSRKDAPSGYEGLIAENGSDASFLTAGSAGPLLPQEQGPLATELRDHLGRLGYGP